MQAFIQRLIREAVSELGAQVDHNWGKSIERMYFPRDKILSLILKIYKRYGYAKTSDEGVKATYDRVLTALKNDPSMDGVEVDQFFVGDFMSSLLQKQIVVRNPLLASKAASALHGSQVKTGNLHVIIGMVAQYDRQNSMRTGKEVVTDEPILFYKLRLMAATHDGRQRSSTGHANRIPDAGSCTSKDQKGNWFIKRGAPPAIHMRVATGNGRILSKIPYEMREGDVFTFRGRVSHTFDSTQGHVMNVIDGVQPV